MRTRDEIEKAQERVDDGDHVTHVYDSELQLEVLLDIRDLLTSKHV